MRSVYFVLFQKISLLCFFRVDAKRFFNVERADDTVHNEDTSVQLRARMLFCFCFYNWKAHYPRHTMIRGVLKHISSMTALLGQM